MPLRTRQLFLSFIFTAVALPAIASGQQTVPMPPYNPGEPAPAPPSPHPPWTPEPTPWQPDELLVEPPMDTTWATLFANMDTDWRSMNCFYQDDFITDETWWFVYVRDWSNFKQITGSQRGVPMVCGGTLQSQIMGGTQDWTCHSVVGYNGEYGIFASFRLSKPHLLKKHTVEAVQDAIFRASMREADHPNLHMQCCHQKDWECLQNAPGQDSAGEGRPVRVDDLYGKLLGHWYFNSYIS